MNLHEKVREGILSSLTPASNELVGQLNGAFRLLAKWRSVLIQNTLIKHEGTRVLQGPLAGLDFIEQSAEGCHIAKLLGTYEQPLQPHIDAAMRAPYEVILNIGCAEGYYAVGWARRVPSAEIYAFDLNPVAQETCKTLAAKNQVVDRLHVGALFTPEDFKKFDSRKTLVLCDIEGAEIDLLNPDLSPSLARMDLIVEAHDCLVPNASTILKERFSKTHEITQVNDNGQRTMENAPAWFYSLAHLDQLIATWEWRSGPTPWLVMRAKV